MKKLIVVGIMVGVLVLALGLAGLAFVQAPTPEPEQALSYGPGMMGGRGFGGMMGSRVTGGYGPMHEYMEQAWAKALGLSEEELEQRLEAGDTVWQIAEDLGFSQEEFADLRIEVRTEALNQAVEAGILTREQADWMIARMAQRQAAGFGPGSGGCVGGRMGGGSGAFAWRWNP